MAISSGGVLGKFCDSAEKIKISQTMADKTFVQYVHTLVNLHSVRLDTKVVDLIPRKGCIILCVCDCNF